MTWLNQTLTAGVLLVAVIVGLQISNLLIQFGSGVQAAEAELSATNREAQATLVYAQAVLASVRGTTETVRRSAVEQTGYYEAAGRRSAMAVARLEILITHTDARMERITQAVETSSKRADENMDQFGFLAASASENLGELSQQGVELLKASTATMERVDQRLDDERLDQIASALAETSESTALATANVAEATGYVRDILSPNRKGFWRRLLEFLIPRLTVNVR
jgi:hypothetical protein